MKNRKLISGLTIVALGAVHIFLMAKGHKVPAGVDQALIAAAGTFFAPDKKDTANEEG